MTAWLSSSIHEGAHEMVKKVDWPMILVVIWLLLHRFVLKWYKY